MNQTLIRNVNIWTMDEEDTRFYGWVLLENGKIASMGEGEAPDCENVIDGEDGVLTPGLIDIHSHIGLYEDGLGFEGADGNEDTDPATPHLRALDGVNPFDRGITFSLFAFGAVTMIAEWKRIAGPAWKKVLYTFTFPLFMLTYVPISIAALVGKVEWKPIQHGIAKVQEERESA